MEKKEAPAVAMQQRLNHQGESPSISRLQQLQQQQQQQLLLNKKKIHSGFHVFSNGSHLAPPPVVLGNNNSSLMSVPGESELARERLPYWRNPPPFKVSGASPHFQISQAQDALRAWNLAHQQKLRLVNREQEQQVAVSDADLSLSLGSSSTNSSRRENNNAQMTMFYNGEIQVYNDVPVGKAQAIMLLAGSISAGSTNPSHIAALNLLLSTANCSKTLTMSSSTSPVQWRAEVTELPQARKASLARFLEKRRERAVMVAPYPPKPGSCSPKPTPSSSSPSLTNEAQQNTEKSPTSKALPMKD